MQNKFSKRNGNSKKDNVGNHKANDRHEYHFYDDEVEIFYEDYFGDAKGLDNFINIDLKKVVFPFSS